jgi:hypothetical protein
MATRSCRICGRVCAPGMDRSYGRCQMCARYWRRHGADRPPLPSGHLPQPGAQPRACSHCGRLAQRRVRGRCMACYQYWRTHGVERPLQPRLVVPPRPCTHCGQPTRRLVRGRCGACYRYWLRRGGVRPLAPRPPSVCQTCSQLGPSLRRGRCPACYMHWYRTGRERPPERWARRVRGAAPSVVASSLPPARPGLRNRRLGAHPGRATLLVSARGCAYSLPGPRLASSPAHTAPSSTQ